MFTDMQKFFNPKAMQETMQQWMNMGNMASSSNQMMGAVQKMNSVWSQNIQAMAKTQAQMAQQSMQENMAAMQEISTANDMEDYMKKQSAWAQKASTNAQKNMQKLAIMYQTAQQEASDSMAKQATESMQAMAKNSR